MANDAMIIAIGDILRYIEIVRLGTPLIIITIESCLCLCLWLRSAIELWTWIGPVAGAMCMHTAVLINDLTESGWELLIGTPSL